MNVTINVYGSGGYLIGTLSGKPVTIAGLVPAVVAKDRNGWFVTCMRSGARIMGRQRYASTQAEAILCSASQVVKLTPVEMADCIDGIVAQRIEA